MAEEVEERKRKNYAMRRRLRTILGLVGFIVLILGGWIIYTFVAKGKIVDLTSERGRKEAFGSLKDDAEKVAETTKPYIEEAATKAKEYYSYSLDQLKNRMKGKPPETKEEITALVKESQEATAQAPSPWDKTSTPGEAAKTSEPAKSGTEPSEPSAPKVTNLPKPAELDGNEGKAQLDGTTGMQAYAKTDPMNSQETVQVHLRIALKFFERSLTEIDKARAEGKGGSLGALEEKVTKRLYDCKKRMEMNPEYDRKAEAEIKKWPW